MAVKIFGFLLTVLGIWGMTLLIPPAPEIFVFEVVFFVICLVAIATGIRAVFD